MSPLSSWQLSASSLCHRDRGDPVKSSSSLLSPKHPHCLDTVNQSVISPLSALLQDLINQQSSSNGNCASAGSLWWWCEALGCRLRPSGSLRLRANILNLTFQNLAPQVEPCHEITHQRQTLEILPSSILCLRLFPSIQQPPATSTSSGQEDIPPCLQTNPICNALPAASFRRFHPSRFLPWNGVRPVAIPAAKTTSVSDRSQPREGVLDKNMTSLTEIRSEMSRRSTRIFVEEQEFVDRTKITMSASSRESSVDDIEKAAHQTKSKSTNAGGDTTQQAMVNVGRSLDIFPITSEDINLHSKFSYLFNSLLCYSCSPFTPNRRFYGICSSISTLSTLKHTAILRTTLLIFK